MKYQIDYVIIKLSENNTTKGVFTYHVITEGGGRSVKGLCMIVGEVERDWT